MALEPGQDGGEPRDDTDYASRSDGGAKPGVVLSAWSLVIGGLFLVLVLGGLILI
ncbi:hypothetical protein [Rhizobium sp. TH135]|uniref:hypothetical protein n=1 Tax=Rhizobium sp. TH135 TaxID=2067451 RepID=UPI001559A80A|nr:hypothetical protein [Rhizobium sp. TH135]